MENDGSTVKSNLQKIQGHCQLEIFGENIFAKINDNTYITADNLLSSGLFYLISKDSSNNEQVEELKEIISEREKEIIILKKEIESIKTTGKSKIERIKDSIIVGSD